EKKVIYANKVAKEMFSREIDVLFGQFSKCNNTIVEKKDCQETSCCKKCVINNTLNQILKDRETKVVNDIEFITNSREFNITCQLDYIDGYIVIEFIHLKIIDDEIALLKRIMNNTKDLLFYKDSNLNYKYANKSYLKFLGAEKKDIIGKSDKDILPKEMVESCLETDIIALEKEVYSGVETIGNRYYSVLKERIDGGIMGLAQDITEEINLYNEANIDELTKLGNRRKFNSCINNIYEIEDNNYYLVLIDIDDFSYVNNSFGHAVGDKYLKELSSILSRYSDLTFYRLGGDEFIGLIPRDIKTVEKRLSCIFEQLNYHKKIKISVGVKKLNLDISYDENYKLIDETLYSSKKKGKNQVSYYCE
ncbi:MAG: diguanylate cyclase, partial [Clostridium sp.]